MKLTIFLALLAIGASGCDSSGSSSDAAPGSTDTGPATGSDAAAGTSDSAMTAGCNFPSCMQALGSACIPQGACTTEYGTGTGTMTVCYENGMRFAVGNVSAGGAVPVTVSNGATTCYTGTAAATGTSVIYTMNNLTGVIIATVTQDLATGETSVACTGGQPVQLKSECWGGTGCALGACP
jgi:hypothetical protein